MILEARMPEPTYPEFARLRDEARQVAARPIDPASVRVKQEVMRRRGADWCVAVLGRYVHGLASLSCAEAEMLVLADAEGVDPPLPQWVVDDRRLAGDREARADAMRAAVDQRDRQAWDAARTQCPVQVEVRRSKTGRPRCGVTHHLGHVVPLVAAVSGAGDEVRRHRPGRALCETERRGRPLSLSGPDPDGPATCVNCLGYTPQIRPA